MDGTVNVIAFHHGQSYHDDDDDDDDESDDESKLTFAVELPDMDLNLLEWQR